MPFLDGHGWQFALLLLALPTQFLLTRYSTPAERDELLTNIMSDVKALPKRFLSFERWRQWCQSVIVSLQDFTGLSGIKSDPVSGETIAKEVHARMGKDINLFGYSDKVRSPRPKEVLFRIGQVVKHKSYQFRAVIVAWDHVAKAPEEWFNENYPEDKRELLMKSPAYRLLVDSRDRPARGSVVYVPQEHLEIIINKKVMHAEINDYFEAYDGAQYLPRPWLRRMYPDD